MTADDRTPDTREVRSMYDTGSSLYRETPEQHYLGHPAPDYGAEFDRWLSRVARDAAVAALRAWAAGVDAQLDASAAEGIDLGDWGRGLRSGSQQARETADQFEEEVQA